MRDRIKVKLTSSTADQLMLHARKDYPLGHNILLFDIIEPLAPDGKNNSTELIIEKKDFQINDDAKNHDFTFNTNASEDYNVAQEVIIHTSLEDHNYSRFQHQLKMHSSALLLEEKSLPEEKNLTQDENSIVKTETVE
ncbi:unnamed protein product [Parnassius apollo]|uniref:(apollo) hypothetical protein n=1 Tax=Parnassius apollo TaxID=110799 RepID=A0A8S3Y6F2_PARAO|nr:unnamed protein product [Parnassius apollo]